MKETYRRDRNNKLSSRAEKANDFHAKQAKKITSENILQREKDVDKANKKRERDQRLLEGQKTKNAGKEKIRHEGKFVFY